MPRKQNHVAAALPNASNAEPIPDPSAILACAPRRSHLQCPVPTVLALLLTACLRVDLGDIDLEPPAVEQTVPPLLPAEPPKTLAPDATLRIRFTEPLDPWSVNDETVLVVAGVAAAEPPCAAAATPEPGSGAGPAGATESSGGASGMRCTDGWCAGGLCLRPAVDRALLRDANDPPLSLSRQSRLHPVAVALSADGREVTVTPKTPYAAPMVYTLVLSAALRDRSGNPLGDAEGHAPGLALSFHVLASAPAEPEPRGSAVTLLAPAPNSRDVPENLAWFDVGIREMPVAPPMQEALQLTGPDGPVPLQLGPAQQRCPGGVTACYRVDLLGPLLPATRYAVGLVRGARDAAGAPLVVSDDQAFTTGGAPDTTPPQIRDLSIEPEGGCLSLRLTTTEAAEVLATWIDGAGQPLAHIGPILVTEPFAGALPGTLLGSGTLSVQAADLANNATSLLAADLPPGPPPPVALSEVLANPIGPEPAQEWIEIVNLGSEAVSLDGFFITDDRDRPGDALPPETLPPGATALVVPAAYDPEQGEDPAPAAGTLLLRIAGSTLGSGGLSNGGEPVWLMGPDGTTVSHYPGAPADGSTPAEGQSVERALGQGCADRSPWRLHPLGSASPGWIDG